MISTVKSSSIWRTVSVSPERSRPRFVIMVMGSRGLGSVSSSHPDMPHGVGLLADPRTALTER
jgi:hypothetical protein